ncbi:MAG TPA: winged helix DNA-binding domain-containing protein [Pengzhenrongella sp.]
MSTPHETTPHETTPHEIALLRLVAQRVVPSLATPRDVVGHLTAVQAQDDVGAITSIALRTARRDRAEVVAAYDAGEIVRSWPMRGTLHTVLARDLAWMLPLMTPRPRAAAAKRRPQLGLGEDDVLRAGELAVAALAGTGGRTRAELLAVWDQAGLAPKGGRGYHLIVELAQRGVLCLGPLRGTDQLFVLLAEWVRNPRVLERDEALAELALHYFRGHGPATVADLSRWSGLAAVDVRAGVESVRDQLAKLTVDRTTYLLDPATPALLDAHRAAARDVLLLPGFDELILGYADRSMTLAPEHADRIVPGGNGVFRPTVLVDGQVVGTWRRVGTGSERRLETVPFVPLADDVAAVVAQRYAQLP